jgi:LAS superfamily LD-carboxypeptidase LdcB
MKNKIFKLIAFIFFSAILVVVAIFAMDELFGLNNAQKIFERIGIDISRDEKVQSELPQLEVTVIEHNQEIIESFTTIVLEANRAITIEDNNRLNLVLVEDTEDIKSYVVEVTNLAFGPSNVSFSVFDSEKNEQEVTVQIDRVENFSFLGEKLIAPWPDSQYVLDGDDLIVFVDKSHRLLNTYEPEDLIVLHDTYVDLFVNNANFELRSEAANQLNLMLEDMRADIGKNVVIASAYRSYNTQVQIYSGYVLSGENTREEVDQFSARPGYSEHQLGTVIDFINEETDFKLTSEFDKTDAGQWLLENSWKYGYIQTYPEGSEEKTGYNYEAWHYRFIGVDNAAEMKEAGLLFIDWINQ